MVFLGGMPQNVGDEKIWSSNLLQVVREKFFGGSPQRGLEQTVPDKWGFLFGGMHPKMIGDEKQYLDQ